MNMFTRMDMRVCTHFGNNDTDNSFILAGKVNYTIHRHTYAHMYKQSCKYMHTPPLPSAAHAHTHTLTYPHTHTHTHTHTPKKTGTATSAQPFNCHELLSPLLAVAENCVTLPSQVLTPSPRKLLAQLQLQQEQNSERLEAGGWVERGDDASTQQAEETVFDGAFYVIYINTHTHAHSLSHIHQHTHSLSRTHTHT